MTFAVSGGRPALSWSLAFLNRGSGSKGVMARPTSEDQPEGNVHDVVPARAVLTELARGFLLVRENDRARAVRFAVTFLRERSAPAERALSDPHPTVTPAQRSLGRSPRGAIERLDRLGPG